MPGPQAPKLRAIEGSTRGRWLVKSRQEAVAVKVKRFSVVSRGLATTNAQVIESLDYLQELESENTKLRSAAIDLALEISALRDN
jgi:hypothetical protein